MDCPRHSPYITSIAMDCSRDSSKQKKVYGPFLCMGFNCLKVTVPLQGDSLLFTAKFPGVPGTHLVYTGRM